MVLIMSGREDRQSRLFSADSLYLEYVGKDTFYGFLAQNRHRLFQDAEFEGLYHQSFGRPGVAPGRLAAALLLQAHDKVSDAEATARARFDLRWKVALGLEIDDSPFAKSTLQTFRAQLILHDKIGTLFRASLDETRLRGLFGKRGKMTLAVDTTPIFGAGAVKDSYNLLADGIRALARALARAFDRPLKEWAAEHDFARYFGSSIKGEADVDWSDEACKRAFLSSIVEDAARLLVIARTARGVLEPDSDDDRAIVRASELLRTLLLQDVEPTDHGEYQLIRGTAKDRIVSTTDPEMRAGHKSASNKFNGHKASIAVDGESGVIVAADVLPGNAPDATGALELVEESETNTGLDAETTVGDCAYGDGATRRAFADEGRELVAKTPKPANRGVFPKQAFAIDLDAETVTCPAGRTTNRWRWARSGEHRVRQYVFPASLCGRCELRERCTKQKSVKAYGRTITLHPEETLLQQARAFQRTDQFKTYNRLRQTVEHRIARLAQLGVRQSRFVGRAKTGAQLLLAAAVANFTLLLRREEGSCPAPAAQPAVPQAA